MEIRQYKVYKFAELSEDGRKKAVEKLYDINVDHDWWDCDYEDAKECLAILGFSIDKIFFSGFSSQGDGACFEGKWDASDYKPTIKKHAPKDKELARISAGLKAIVKKYPDAGMRVKQSGHYMHKYCTSFEVWDNSDDSCNSDANCEEEIIELSRDAMEWIYRRLEEQYYYLTSEKVIIETIEANDYDFTEDGKID